MSDVYRRLARRLDELPNGFPATDRGVELKILRKIFSSEDAEIALRLSPIPEPVEAIAARLGRPIEEARVTLDAMAEKGQIGSFTAKGRQLYVLVPFVIGIYEFQLGRVDEELAELMAEYEPALMQALGGTEPALARVIPINAPIDAEHQVLRYEDVRQMIEEAKSFCVRDCICRKERAIEGKRCEHTLENCLTFSDEEHAFDYHSYGGRIISKEEALAILDAAEQEGLIHCTYNIQHGHRWICNCCACCCGLLRGLKAHNAPHVVAGSNYVALIDAENCSACGTCADERCAMDAIVRDNGSYKVIVERCIGCGVCTITCPGESITLVLRPESEQDLPPEDIKAWMMTRGANRLRGLP